MHILNARASPEFGTLPPTSTIVLLPRNVGGQHYVVVSHLTAIASIEAMRRYIRFDSKMMMVSAMSVS